MSRLAEAGFLDFAGGWVGVFVSSLSSAGRQAAFGSSAAVRPLHRLCVCVSVGVCATIGYSQLSRWDSCGMDALCLVGHAAAARVRSCALCHHTTPIPLELNVRSRVVQRSVIGSQITKWDSLEAGGKSSCHIPTSEMSIGRSDSRIYGAQVHVFVPPGLSSSLIGFRFELACSNVLFRQDQFTSPSSSSSSSAPGKDACRRNATRAHGTHALGHVVRAEAAATRSAGPLGSGGLQGKLGGVPAGSTS